jgi:hypothetical protein
MGTSIGAGLNDRHWSCGRRHGLYFLICVCICICICMLARPRTLSKIAKRPYTWNCSAIFSNCRVCLRGDVQRVSTGSKPLQAVRVQERFAGDITTDMDRSLCRTIKADKCQSQRGAGLGAQSVPSTIFEKSADLSLIYAVLGVVVHLVRDPLCYIELLAQSQFAPISPHRD